MTLLFCLLLWVETYCKGCLPKVAYCFYGPEIFGHLANAHLVERGIS